MAKLINNWYALNVMVLTRREFLEELVKYGGAIAAVVSGLECMVPIKEAEQVPKLRKTIEDPLDRLDLSRNICHLVLDIESQVIEVPETCRQLLDEILASAEEKIDATKSPEEILKTIGSILTNDFNYKYKKEINTLTEVLRGNRDDKKEIDCSTLSFIYLAIGEMLGFPLALVSVPTHTFVRWQIDNGTYINWDTTGPLAVPDEKYIELLDISKESIKNGVYLRSLSRKEVLGFSYYLVGNYLAELKRYEEAIRFYEIALKINPDDILSLTNKGNCLVSLNRFEEAIHFYDMALALDIYDAEILTNKGVALYRAGKYDESLKLFITAKTLKSK